MLRLYGWGCLCHLAGLLQRVMAVPFPSCTPGSSSSHHISGFRPSVCAEPSAPPDGHMLPVWCLGAPRCLPQHPALCSCPSLAPLLKGSLPPACLTVGGEGSKAPVLGVCAPRPLAFVLPLLHAPQGLDVGIGLWWVWHTKSRSCAWI